MTPGAYVTSFSGPRFFGFSDLAVVDNIRAMYGGRIVKASFVTMSAKLVLHVPEICHRVQSSGAMHLLGLRQWFVVISVGPRLQMICS